LAFPVEISEAVHDVHKLAIAAPPPAIQHNGYPDCNIGPRGHPSMTDVDAVDGEIAGRDVVNAGHLSDAVNKLVTQRA
jgi:hypothetical protein